MAPPASAELLLSGKDKNWVWNYGMGAWKPKEEYSEASPYDKYIIQFPPWWSAYLKAKALEGPEPPAPAPEFTIAEPYFTVKKSAKGGYGAFASQDIPEGTVFHQEYPLLSICGYWELEKKFRALTDEQKSIFVNMAIYERGHSKIRDIFGVNCFRCGPYLAVFAVCCRFNHACEPRNNVNWHWNESIGTMVLTAVKSIKKDEELTLSYGHNPEDFPILYGFECDCGCKINKPAHVETEKEKEKETESKAREPVKKGGSSKKRMRGLEWRYNGGW